MFPPEEEVRHLSQDLFGTLRRPAHEKGIDAFIGARGAPLSDARGVRIFRHQMEAVDIARKNGWFGIQVIPFSSRVGAASRAGERPAAAG